MKIFMLILLLACLCLAATNADVQNSEQGNRFKLVSQRIRSLRDSLGVKLPVDSKKPKPVEPLRDEDHEDPWDFGTFFGQFSTKVGTVVQNAVEDLLECVDNVFKCLRPGGDKKDKKNQKENKPEPGAADENAKPRPTEEIKPVATEADGSAVVSKSPSEELTEAVAKPVELVVGTANGVKGEIVAEKPAVAEKVEPPIADKLKPIEAIIDSGVKP